jgi:hypothetical protein
MTLSLLLLGLVGSTATADDGRLVRGVTVSCPTWGGEWATPAMDQALDELQALGTTWVAIHPYAGISADGTVRPWGFGEGPPDWITHPIAAAHARGLRVMVVPHLAHWGSPFQWRGEIHFPEEAAQRRFFESYAQFLRQVAAAAAGADALSVGSELDATARTAQDEARWRALIEEVRGRFSGKLTYAANWTDAERIPFWDALDAVGVQAYYPLVGPGEAPDEAALRLGWERVLERLSALHRRTGKPVVLTELGYPRSLRAAEEPWAHVDDPGGEAVQVACLRAALQTLDRPDVRPWLVGAFLWKWFPGPKVPEDFALVRPAAQAVVREAWDKGETSP